MHLCTFMHTYTGRSIFFYFPTAAPPVFIKIPPSFVEVLLGESLTLSCGAHGNPKPKVTWRKGDNGEKIQVVQLKELLI